MMAEETIIAMTLRVTVVIPDEAVLKEEPLLVLSETGAKSSAIATISMMTVKETFPV